jgi:D-alanyl-D-alanine carboxypeptidase/D-alanyl-D-alanine-endopeptidase (penicillin-binding protein 4)
MKLLHLLIPVIVLSGCSTGKRIAHTVHPERDTALSNAFTGICLYDETADKMVFQHNAEKQFIPASNMKLFTSYAVMKYLPDSLPGWFIHESPDSLYLQPNGDPSFLHPSFPSQKIFDLLKANRKPVVLVIPPVSFTPRGFGWAWNNYQEFYMPERSAMPIYGNVVRFQKLDNGLHAIPAYFQSRLTVNDLSGKAVNVRRVEDGNEFTAGNAAVNYLTRPFTQKEDPDFVYTLLSDTLSRLGIDRPTLRKSAPGIDFKPFYTQQTDSVLQFMMLHSDNFFAEQLLLMAGRQHTGKLADRLMIDTLMKHDHADLPDHPRWVDGSGLSRNNLVSPRAFVTLLHKMKKEFGWARVSAALVNGGEGGTLRDLYSGYPQNIFAKTGTLNGQATLSGFILTKKERLLSFSFLVNNHQAAASAVKTSIKSILTKIIDHY